MSSIDAASARAVRGSVSSQDTAIPQRLPQVSKDNNSISRLAKHVEQNQQASAVTLHETLGRYLSSPDAPTPMLNHNSIKASEVVHIFRAQNAMDAFDAAMKG